MPRQDVKGFTLIELIMVIVIIGILATMTTEIITLPVKSYIDLERRTALVDTAEITLRRMQRDIRRALPNSIRITNGGTVIELLHTKDGGRYRAKKDSGDPSSDHLDFTDLNDNSFEVIGALSNTPTSHDELVIYNLGSIGADAYSGENRRNITAPLATNKLVFNLPSPKTLFPFPSPQQRFCIVDTPITYSCSNNELRRYDNSIDALYNISSTAPTLASLNYKIQAKANTLACSFSYDDGAGSRAGLVTLEITLTDNAGESAKLIHQVHVDNMP